MANYSTSYFGDDDEEEKRRALSALAGADATGSFDQDFSNDPEALAGSQPQYDQTPPEPEPPTAPVGEREPTSRTLDSGRSDPFDEAAAAMASEHPEASSGGGEDWGPLGGGVGWALAADLLLNGGRNATTVMALGAQAAEQRKKAGLEGDYKRAQIEHLKHQGVTDPRVLEQRQRQMDQRDRALGHGEAVLDDRQNARGEKTAQGKANTDAVLGLYDREGLDTSPLKGGNMEAVRAVSPVLRRQYDVAHADETNAIAAEKAGGVARAQTQSRSDVGAENADQDAETAARRAGAVAEAQAPYAVDRAVEISGRTLPDRQKLKASPGSPGAEEYDPETGERVPTTGDMRADTLKRRQGLETPIPGTEVVDQPAWQASVQTPAARGQVATLTRGYQQVTDGINRMIDIRKRVGPELYGKDKADYDAAQLAVIGGYTKIGESGVLNGGEYQRYAERIPSIRPGMNDVLGLATGKDEVLEQLTGLKSSTDASVDTSLSAYGLRKARPNSAAIAPEMGGDSLPVTGQKRRDIPKVDDYLRKYGASWVR